MVGALQETVYELSVRQRLERAGSHVRASRSLSDQWQSHQRSRRLKNRRQRQAPRSHHLLGHLQPERKAAGERSRRLRHDDSRSDVGTPDARAADERERLGSARSTAARRKRQGGQDLDRKSTRLNSSHPSISYAVFCVKKKNQKAVPEGMGSLQEGDKQETHTKAHNDTTDPQQS